MESKINIFYQNARGLRTKASCFKRNVLLNNYDIISISETWLLDGIHNEELFDDRYIVWRRDRDYSSTKQSLGGGVLLGVRREFATIGRPEWSSTAEDIWVTLIPNKFCNFSTNIHLCTIYLCRQNMGNTETIQLENFSQNLFDIVNSCPNDEFIIMGDFNLPHINWDRQGDHTTINGLPLSGAQLNFLDTLLQCDLTQQNQIRNDNNRYLDLVFSNRELDISACGDPLVPDDIPHHRSINVFLSHYLKNTLQTKNRIKHFYNSGNFDLINKSLDEINWAESLNGKTLDEALKHFYNTLYALRSSHVPNKLIHPNSCPVWYSSALIKVLKEKHKFFRKFKRYGNRSDYAAFELLRKRSKSLEKSCYESYIHKVQDSITNDPRTFWSFIKGKSKASSSLPSTMTLEGDTASTGEKICDLFATYFHSNFLQPTSSSNLTLPNINKINNLNIGDIIINDDELLKQLESVNVNKGAGPDDIAPIFIKKCARSLVTPLSIIFKRSMSEGYVPNNWKAAFITPVYKAGSKNNIKNYRPISKLCIFSKIFERIVYSQVYAAIQPWFIQEQHGFLRGRSTTSNLLLTYDFVSSSMDSGYQVDIIYTDLSKAFDRIDHCILLEKLKHAGIHGNLFRWFTSYIQNRSQAVALNGYVSTWMPVPSGVPQGSLLGPLLFTIFLNDVSSCFLNSRFLLYADDTKIIKRITSNDDHRLLQDDLDRFSEYCCYNKLDLNVSKCFVVSFTRRLRVLSYNYTFNNQALVHKTKIKDLGVIVDHKLLFEEHIDHIVKKASKALGFVIRSCKDFRSLKPIKVLFCSYVRSVLEYCSEVWNPAYDIYINRIELIQKKFLRYLQYKCGDNLPTYEARCKKYHFLPLNHRRNISDLVYLNKIINNIVDSVEIHNQIKINVPTKFFRTYVPFYVPPYKTNYRRNSFICRSTTQFNAFLLNHPDIDTSSLKSSSVRQLMIDKYLSVDN